MWLRARFIALPGRIYQRLIGDIGAGEPGAAAAGLTQGPEPGWTGWLLHRLSAAPRPWPLAAVAYRTGEDDGAAPDAAEAPETGEVETGRVETGPVETGRVETGQVMRGPWPAPRGPRA